MNEFHGKIGRTREQSTPYWVEREPAKPGSPNIVIIYMDDMGWSDPGCYGSEIDTPHLDALAARGLLFTHYTTHPICSPARAALLTGRNSHAVGTGWLANNNAGYPGYSGEIPLDQPTLAETLRAAGYETIMTGKWHNTPTPDTVVGGSKHNWPSQRGFDSFMDFWTAKPISFFRPGCKWIIRYCRSINTRTIITLLTIGLTARYNALKNCVRRHLLNRFSRILPITQCMRRCNRNQTIWPNIAVAMISVGMKRDGNVLSASLRRA